MTEKQTGKKGFTEASRRSEPEAQNAPCNLDTVLHPAENSHRRSPAPCCRGEGQRDIFHKSPDIRTLSQLLQTLNSESNLQNTRTISITTGSINISCSGSQGFWDSQAH